MFSRAFWFSMIGFLAAVCGPSTIAAGTTTPMLVYSVEGSNIPDYKTWSGSSWSSITAMSDIGDKPQWAVAATCPTRDEKIAVYSDAGGKKVHAFVYNGTSFGAQFEPTADIASVPDRPYYFAYEQLSGDGLVVCRKKDENDIHYRIWNGTAWGAVDATYTLSTSKQHFIKLVPKPASDEIMAVTICEGKSPNLIGVVWNGSSFGNEVLLETDTSYYDSECFDAAYEYGTGRCMVVWGAGGKGAVPQYRIWSGSSWGTTGDVPTVGKQPRWVRLASDPASNKIAMLTLDDDNDINCNIWSGSAWGTNQEFATDSPSKDRRNMDIAFTRTGTNALAVYSRGGHTSLYYRTYNGSAWSAEQIGPTIGQVMGIVQLRPTSGQEIFVGAMEYSISRMHFTRWDGTAFANTQMMAADVSGTAAIESFMYATEAGGLEITSWAEVQP